MGSTHQLPVDERQSYNLTGAEQLENRFLAGRHSTTVGGLMVRQATGKISVVGQKMLDVNHLMSDSHIT